MKDILRSSKSIPISGFNYTIQNSKFNITQKILKLFLNNNHE